MHKSQKGKIMDCSVTVDLLLVLAGFVTGWIIADRLL